MYVLSRESCSGGQTLPHSSLLNRRGLLSGAVAAASIAFVKPVPAVSFTPRSVSLYNTHTGEWVRSVYWADGHYIREAVKDINWVLRDHHSGDVCPMNAGLLDLLQLLRTQLDCQDPFLVVSGYRSAATNAWMHAHRRGVASKSFHIKGMAIDLRCEGRDLSQLHRAAISLRAGGVGYYPKSDFVHVDCGPIRYW
jgi:uncharacterized protein YcbK (DUF882 family)